MKKPVLIVGLLAVVGFLGWILFQNQSPNYPVERTYPTNDTINSSSKPTSTDFQATFEIYTQGTKRIFTDTKYHNQSPDVFIQNPDPSIIYVKKSGVTWSDFFATLPFSLNKTCLVTGTKQTFCNTESQKLRFFLNGSEVPDALDLEIQPNEALRVTYGN